MSIYALKPRFQALLRPAVQRLHAAGVTANQVTLSACAISLALGLGLTLAPVAAAFALVPLWMLLRMAFNAMDGMLAREFGQKTPLGAFLNELTDVLSDAALYLPFAAIAPFSPFWIGVVVLLSAMSEFAGALGLWVALDAPLPAWAAALMPVLAGLVAWTIVNRVQRALAEAPKE